MAIASELQFLKKGKALCGKVFPNFAATWNWLVNAMSNLQGDADVNSAQGRITVDRSDPAHPIIRYVAPESGSGGGSGGSGSGDPPENDDEGGEATCVTSLNGATGAVSVIGGKGISVSTNGQTIKVTWNEDKEDEDEDPNADGKADPCAHDGKGGKEGGVEVSDEDEESGGHGGGGVAGGADEAGEGGVEANGDEHEGDNSCNECD